LIDSRTMWALHAGEYLAARDALGSPVPPLTSGDFNRVPSWAVDRVMVDLFADRVTVGTGDTPSANLPCRNVDSQGAGTLEFRVPDDQTIILQSSRSGSAAVSLGYLNLPTPT